MTKPMRVRESIIEERRRAALGPSLEAPDELPRDIGEPPAPPPARAPAPAASQAEPAAPFPGYAPQPLEPRPGAQAAAAQVQPAPAVQAAAPAPARPVPTPEPEPALRSAPAAAEAVTTAASTAPRPAPYAPPAEPARAAPSPVPSPAPEAYAEEAEDEEDAFVPGHKPRSPRARRPFSLSGDPYDPKRYKVRIFDLMKEEIGGKERPVKYTVLDNAYDVMSEEQSPGEQAVYIKLYRMSYGFGNRTCVVSVLELAHRMQVARNTIRAYLRGLEDKGHIREEFPEYKNRGKVYYVELPREYLARKAEAQGQEKAARAYEESLAKLKELGIL